MNLLDVDKFVMGFKKKLTERIDEEVRESVWSFFAFNSKLRLDCVFGSYKTKPLVFSREPHPSTDPYHFFFSFQSNGKLFSHTHFSSFDPTFFFFLLYKLFYPLTISFQVLMSSFWSVFGLSFILMSGWQYKIWCLVL